MSAQVIVYLGPGRSEKRAELLRQYREALSAPGPIFGRSLWIAPNARAAGEVRSQLLDENLDSCLEPSILTFDDLVRRCLVAAKSRLRIISPTQERELLRRTVRAAIEGNELTYYAQTARRENFVKLLDEHIRELRRRGIPAEKFARLTSRAASSEQHRELARLYLEYDRVLTTNGLLDGESVPWAACDAVASETSHLFQNLCMAVVDGFSDFTAAQHRLLTLISKQAKQLLISLPTDDLPAARRADGLSKPSRSRGPRHSSVAPRTDLFAKPCRTLSELRHDHPRLEERHFASPASQCPALAQIGSQIFRHPVSPAGAEVLESLNRLELVEASGAQDEIVQIAGRVKRLLTRGASWEGQGEDSPQTPTRPEDIVVVFRSLSEAAPRVRGVFSQFGIPYSLELSESLSAAPIIKTLLVLLKLDAEDWPFRQTVAVLTNNLLTAIGDDARRGADWLVRDLQIACGRQALLDRVEQLAVTKTPLEQLGDRAGRRVVAAISALPALEMLGNAFDDLPKEAAPREWADALVNLAAKLGFAPATGASCRFDAPQLEVGDAPISTDQTAWQLILEHLALLQRLDEWLGQPPRPLLRNDLMISLRDLAQQTMMPRRNDDVGRVRVLSAPTARALNFKHMFIGGMAEQSFPAAERPGRLATEADYRFFARAASQKRRGVASAQQTDEPTRSQEEMLLFYELLGSAQESITISYAALDEKAQTLPPSPYVTELCRAIGARDSPQFRVTKPHLSPIPPGAGAFSLPEWRLQAVAKALGGNCESLAGLLSSQATAGVGRAIECGMRIVHARSRRDGFSPAEGLMASPAAAARFAERFGPRHLWSPSQWETYAGCPYRFFLESVLRLEPLGDLALETDFARRGGRLHDVLAEFHRQWPEMRKTTCTSPEDEPAAFVEHLKGVIDKTIAGTSHAGVDAALLELDRRQIARWADGHYDHHHAYARHCQKAGGQFEPTHFELRFGPARPGDADNDPYSCDEPFKLKVNGETVLVSGRIDRVDVARIGEQVLLNVIDYKSGRKPRLQEEQIASGEHLQLPIYVAAAQAILYDGAAQPLAAGYWSMAGGFDAKGVLAVQQEEAEQHWARIYSIVEKRVGELIKSIRHGDFPVFSQDDKCTSYCDFHSVCRITQVRSLGKTWLADEQCGSKTAH